MNLKRKSAGKPSSKAVQEAATFLWHFRPPWRDKFSHEHWWTKHSNDAHVNAAVWEVLRRHPFAEKLVSGELTDTSILTNYVEDFITAYALKPWSMLSEEQKEDWVDSLQDLPPQRGVCPDSRPAMDVIGGPDDSDAEKIRVLGKQHWDYVRTGSHGKAAFRAWKTAKRIWEKSFSHEFIGSGVSSDAFFSLTKGHVLIGFDPNRPGIEKLVERKVRAIARIIRQRSGAPVTAGRSFWPEWLDSISDFERKELARKRCERRDEELFTRYRRMIRPWRLSD